MNFLTQLPYLLETLLEVVLLVFLLQGPFRKYLVFTVYIFSQIVTHLMVTTAFYADGFTSVAYRNRYWADEITQDLLLFLVVIAFTYEALRDNPLRPKAAKALAVILVVGLALPLTMLNSYRSRSHGSFSTQWFSHAAQIFSFAAAIMNLVLWTALLSNRRRDPQLVSLSVGLGMLTAAGAIVWGVREYLPQADRWPLDTMVAVTRIGSLLLWCQTFRRSAGRSPSPPPAASALTTQS